jgi:hypothetical protein
VLHRHLRLSHLYIQYNKQEDCIPMVSPTPRILSEIFMQNVEDKYFEKTIEHHIKLQARYVYDISIIFITSTQTNRTS